MNYTPEQTEYMISQYTSNPSRATVNELADELGKSIKSIIGKLSREGVYRREVYLTKRGEKPITKLEIVASIENELGMEKDDLLGLEKAPKMVLKKLEQSLLN